LGSAEGIQEKYRTTEWSGFRAKWWAHSTSWQEKRARKNDVEGDGFSHAANAHREGGTGTAQRRLRWWLNSRPRGEASEKSRDLLFANRPVQSDRSVCHTEVFMAKEAGGML